MRAPFVKLPLKAFSAMRPSSFSPSGPCRTTPFRRVAALFGWAAAGLGCATAPAGLPDQVGPVVTLEARLAARSVPSFGLLSACDCGLDCFSEWRLCDLTRLVFTVTEAGSGTTTHTDTAGGYSANSVFRIKSLKPNKTYTIAVEGFAGGNPGAQVTASSPVTITTAANGQGAFTTTITQDFPLPFLAKAFSGRLPVVASVATPTHRIDVVLQRDSGGYLDVATGSLDGAGGSLTFTGLKADATYRVVGKAYDASSTLLSTTNSSPLTAAPTNSTAAERFATVTLSI